MIIKVLFSPKLDRRSANRFFFYILRYALNNTLCQKYILDDTLLNSTLWYTLIKWLKCQSFILTFIVTLQERVTWDSIAMFSPSSSCILLSHNLIFFLESHKSADDFCLFFFTLQSKFLNKIFNLNTTRQLDR